MKANRRHLLRGGLGLSAGVLGLGPATSAFAADSLSLAPLRAAGLDPFETYVRMFASKTKGDEMAWWFMGALPRDVENVGPVDTHQEETVRIHRVESVKPGEVAFLWTEAGVFRDILTGEVPTAAFDAITGETKPHASVLAGKGMTAKVIVQKAGDSLKVLTEIPGNKFGEILVGASIDGNRVCLTHLEDKTRDMPEGGMAPTNTTAFKIYANLSDLKSNAPSVAASGYYGVKNKQTGNIFVNGLMHKAAMDAKVNPIAFERIKKHHPTFLKGDRFAPTWGS